MKLSKNLGRIATTFLATAMLASVSAVPAFAEGEPVVGAIGNQGYYSDSSNTGIDAFTFTKELEMPEGVAKPNVKFTFKLTAAEPYEGETAEDNAQNTADVQKGEGTIADAYATFDSNVNYSDVVYNADTADEYTNKLGSVTVQFNVGNIEFTEPGVYKYKLEEVDTPITTDASASDFTTSTLDRTVYLYVQRINEGTPQEDIVVTGVELYNGEIVNNESNIGKTDSVLNYYMLTGDPDQPDPDNPPKPVANDMTIEKVVKGTMGNKSEDFTFSFTVSSETQGKTFNYVVTNDNNPGQTQTATAGTPVTSVTLQDGDTIKITGLTGTDKVTVEETDNGEGYTTSYQVTNGALVSGQKKAENVTLATEKNGDNEDVPVSTTVTFTNERNAVSPTGIVMNVAPYVLLVVVAAAGCFVFLRKRRED